MRRSMFVAFAVAATAILLALPPAYANSTNGTYFSGYDRHLPSLLDLTLAPAVEPMRAKAESQTQLVKQQPISAAYAAVGSGSALPPGVTASVVLREREPVPYHCLL